MGRRPMLRPASQEARYLPSAGDTDQLDRTARQVRIPNRTCVHTVHAATFDPDAGISYHTVCEQVLRKAAGAVLTTRATTCTDCLGMAAMTAINQRSHA